jgi:hypothetical protein
MSAITRGKVRPGQRLAVGDQVSLDAHGMVVKHNHPQRAVGIIGSVVAVQHGTPQTHPTVDIRHSYSPAATTAPRSSVPGNRYCQTERLDRLLDKLQELRGISRACSECPVRLSCLAEQVIGYWCPKCCFYYIKEIDKRLDCDAYITHEAVEKGLCPTCDGGRKTEVIRGFALDWNEE